MLAWIARGLAKGRITTRYPRGAEPPPPGYHGPIAVLDSASRRPRAGALCPTGAIGVDRTRRAQPRSRAVHPVRRVRARRPGAIRVHRALRGRRPHASFAGGRRRRSRRRATGSASARASRRGRSAAPSTSVTSTPAPTAPRSGRSRRCGTRTTTSSASGSSSPPHPDMRTSCSSPAVSPTRCERRCSGPGRSCPSPRRWSRSAPTPAQAVSRPRLAGWPAASTRSSRSTCTSPAHRRRRSRCCTGCCSPSGGCARGPAGVTSLDVRGRDGRRSA